VLSLDGGLFGRIQGSSCPAKQIPLLYADQEWVMAATMQLLSADSTDVQLHDQQNRASCLGERESVMNPVAGIAFAQLAKGLALALAEMAGISVATRSPAADETSKN
jgi:hypothetical protein